MKKIILALVDKADDKKDFDLAKIARDLINEFALTWNAPCSWGDIAEELSREYNKDSWVYEAMELWEYEED